MRVRKQSRKSIAVLVALAFVITLMTAVGTSAQSASSAHPVQVPQGAEAKGSGRRQCPHRRFVQSPRPWRRRDYGALDGPTQTSLRTARGLRGKKEYPVTYIMRGLRLQAQGTGDADG